MRWLIPEMVPASSLASAFFDIGLRTMTMLTEQEVRAIDILRDADDRAVRWILGIARGRKVDRNQTLVTQNETTHDVFLITRGSVRVTVYSRYGKEISFRDMFGGQSFGELAAIDGNARSASVIALEPSQVATITAQEFLKLLEDHPEVARATMRKLVGFVRSLSQRVYEFSMPVPNRIFAELLRAARLAMINDTTARIVPAPKHADLAARINTHREAVSRTMSDLQRRRIIQRGRGELLVLDVPTLTRLADIDDDY